MSDTKPTTLLDIYAVAEQYRESVGELRQDFDLDAGQRREIVDGAYEVAVATQQPMIDKYLDERAAQREALTAVLYHGGPAFNDAITRYATASHDELRQAANVARRTDNRELLRAVAVTAYETGDADMFHGLISGGDPELTEAFRELEQLGDERDDAARLRQVAVKPMGHAGGPQVEDITPSQVEAVAEHNRRVEAGARALHQAAVVKTPRVTRRRAGVGPNPRVV